MMKKKFLVLSCLWLMAIGLQAQAPNPFESIGKNAPEILSLSKGAYPEIFKNDSLRKIGQVVFNTKTNTIEYFIQTDTLYSEATLEPEIVSRWLSIDPLAHKFPDMSPYNSFSNNPIYFIDPTGMESEPPYRRWDKKTRVAYKQAQKIQESYKGSIIKIYWENVTTKTHGRTGEEYLEYNKNSIVTKFEVSVTKLEKFYYEIPLENGDVRIKEVDGAGLVVVPLYPDQYRNNNINALMGNTDLNFYDAVCYEQDFGYQAEWKWKKRDADTKYGGIPDFVKAVNSVNYFLVVANAVTSLTKGENIYREKQNGEQKMWNYIDVFPIPLKKAKNLSEFVGYGGMKDLLLKKWIHQNVKSNPDQKKEDD